MLSEVVLEVGQLQGGAPVTPSTVAPHTPTIGSLCTGYGGLDLAVEAVVMGARTVWTAEFDKQAAKVTAARWPVPNLGDITKVDWGEVAPVDILTAGYPCQPFSYAGARRGTADPRHIWPNIIEAVRHLGPSLVCLENVPGHLTRGFGDVLGSLAEAGYDARWTCVRAADIGAPHKRERVFIVATRGAPLEPVGEWGGPADSGAADQLKLFPTPTAWLGRRPCQSIGDPERWLNPKRSRELSDCVAWLLTQQPPLKLLPTPVAHPSANTPENHLAKKNRLDGGNRTQVTDIAVLVRQQWGHLPQLLPTPTITDSKGGRNLTLGHADRTDAHHGTTLTDLTYGGHITAVDWGEYAPAVERWEPIIGRPAPSPVRLEGRREGRLCPVFVEWMMGLPLGWVTDVGVSDTAALKALGNGVVPAQAELALRQLLGSPLG